MAVWRTWIFPSLKLVLFLVIAAALVKIAFFPAAAETTGVEPGATITDPTVAMAKGSIVNDLKVDASVEADPAVPARAGLVGEIASLSTSAGQAVTAGQTLAVIRQEISPAIPAEEGIPAKKAVYKTLAVTAPIAGTVKQSDMIEGQPVAIGDTVMTISPGTYSVKAALQVTDLYRLQERPGEATVDIKDGPAGFTCTGLQILSEQTPATTTPGSGETPASESGPVARCAVPAEVTVFAGLSATMSIAGSRADDVMVLPITAVRGTAGQGVVYVSGENGPEEREVQLGLADKENVQITGGLEEGVEVLQYVPAGEGGNITDPAGEECVETPDGGMACPGTGGIE